MTSKRGFSVFFPRKWDILEKKESDVTQTMTIENFSAEIRRVRLGPESNETCFSHQQQALCYIH